MWPIIGTLGMLAIEASYVPQILRLFRTKDARGISVLFPGLNLTGRLMAFAYAVQVGEVVLGAGFMVGIVLRATFLFQTIAWRDGPAHIVAKADAVTPDAEQARGLDLAPRPVLVPVPVHKGDV